MSLNRRYALLVAALLFLIGPLHAQSGLGPAERIADGVLLYRLADESLLDPAGPVAVQALRLDPKKVELQIALAEDRSPARETVASIARRRNAIAATNGGFFALTDGAPLAIVKIGGRLIGGSARPRGAVGITTRRGATRLIFDRVTVDRRSPSPVFHPRLGSKPADWARASFILSGAGLLLRDGREIADWKDEQLSAAFETTRHPRTMIGVDTHGVIWLVTVDGRQPALSLGMTFAELTRLAHRLDLTSALNLDGGGSTTMVVQGERTVNHPSDPTGPRPVSDAFVVLPRR